MSRIHGLNDLTDNLAGDGDYAYQPDAASAAAGPLMMSATLTQALYVTERGDSGTIAVDDINQGQMGDCFLLSSIGEIALLKPQFISNMIRVNANGTETVTLYVASNGHLPTWNTTAFAAVGVTVSNVFPNYAVNNGATQDVFNGMKEIWPQVLEKAVATLYGSYAGIANGGSPVIAMEELTGHAASFMAPANLTLATLQNLIHAGDMIVFDTSATGALPNNLVNNHAYMFESVSGSGAGATVQLGNPWGFNQPSPILLSQLSRSFAEVDVGHLA